MREILKTLGVLGNPVRLRLRRLLRGQELCVCEFVDALRIPQYAVSRHLRSLRALGLVAARRDWRWMHYRLGSEMNDRGCGGAARAVILKTRARCKATMPLRPRRQQRGGTESAGALTAPADCSILSCAVSFFAGLAHQFCLELPHPLDRRDHFFRGGGWFLHGDARFLLDPIRRGSFHACKPLQGLFHFSLAAPSGHAGDGEYQLFAVSHVILLVVGGSRLVSRILARGRRGRKADSLRRKQRGEGAYPLPPM